jgi:aspartate carbamoyltransferase regulatory subunit
MKTTSKIDLSKNTGSRQFIETENRQLQKQLVNVIAGAIKPIRVLETVGSKRVVEQNAPAYFLGFS